MSAQHTPQQAEAVRELQGDYGRDLCQCHQCAVFHFNSDARCPECGAGLFWQCWTEKGDNDKPVASHKSYAKAYASKAQRLRRQADECEKRAEAHRSVIAKAQEGASHG